MHLGDVGENAAISTRFHNTLSVALEELRYSVASEFERSLQHGRRVHGQGIGTSNVGRPQTRAVSWALPSPLVESTVSDPVRRAWSPPSLGSPKDRDQDFMLSIEDSLLISQWEPEQRHSDSSSVVMRLEEAEVAHISSKSSRQKKVTMDSNSTTSSSDHLVASVGPSCSPSSAERSFHVQYSRECDRSQTISYALGGEYDSVEYEIEQPFLVISPFWTKLYEAGLHNAILGNMGEEYKMAESMKKDISRMATSKYDEEELRKTTFSAQTHRKSSLWIIEQLQLDDEESLCFRFLNFFVVLPEDRSRIFWSFLSLLFLIYDGVMIPIDECFDADEVRFLQVMQWIIQFFWSIDVIVSFLTAYSNDGYIVKSPGAIADHYFKTWFLFDMTLVSLEWVLLCVKDLSGGSSISLLRNFRAFRIFRMVRLLRFARLWKMLPFIKRFLVLSSQGVGASMLLFAVVLACFLFAHIGACLWHLVGASIDGGWVYVNGFQDYPTSRKYLVSLHYMFIRLQGSSSSLVIVNEPLELIFDTLILFASLLLTSVLLSVVAQALVVWIRSDVAQIKKLAIIYLRRHQIDAETRTRVNNYLQANQMAGPGEMLMGESKFLKALPVNIQEDLLFESRRVVMCRVSVLSVIVTFSSRCVRAICQKSVSDILAVEGELIFQKGDENLGEVYFIRMGKLLYTCDEDILQGTPRSSSLPRDSRQPAGMDAVRRGAVVSEVALFVNHWLHVGDLAPERDSILMILDVRGFVEIVESYRMASICALKYARHFVWSLNRSVRCDLSGFDFSVARLDEEFFSGTAEDHFAFISHYKVEAGTEATLLRDLMEQKIREDPSNIATDFLSPIFVDSEDLVDLTRLEQHVIGSINLILLLTPGILTRPWCLMEIVTAFNHDVQVIPVEVQRPGMKYEYPDDDWYRNFLNGKILARSDEELLVNEGHTLASVGEAVRQLFKKISLPFSPHKSGNVRKAEIEDIMKRCDGLDLAPPFTNSRSSAGADSKSNSLATTNSPMGKQRSINKHRVTVVRNGAHRTASFELR